MVELYDMVELVEIVNGRIGRDGTDCNVGRIGSFSGNGSIGRIGRFDGNGGKNCTLFRFVRKFENVLYEPRKFHVISKKFVNTLYTSIFKLIFKKI